MKHEDMKHEEKDVTPLFMFHVFVFHAPDARSVRCTISAGAPPIIAATSARVGRVPAPNSVGEVGLLLEEPRTATVVAVGHLVCLVLPRQEFRQVVNEDPSVGAKILKGAARRLREVERSLAT